MKSLFTYLVLAFLISSVSMAAPQPEKEQIFKLKYLSEVTRGQVIHTVEVKARDFNEALTKSRKTCMNDLLDRHIASEDIIDMCANPRL